MTKMSAAKFYHVPGKMFVALKVNSFTTLCYLIIKILILCRLSKPHANHEKLGWRAHFHSLVSPRGLTPTPSVPFLSLPDASLSHPNRRCGSNFVQLITEYYSIWWSLVIFLCMNAEQVLWWSCVSGSYCGNCRCIFVRSPCPSQDMLSSMSSLTATDQRIKWSPLASSGCMASQHHQPFVM